MSNKISHCPHCDNQFDVEDESMIGQSRLCNSCNKMFFLNENKVFKADEIVHDDQPSLRDNESTQKYCFCPKCQKP